MSDSKQHTPGPWIRFVDNGHTTAILPAGRPGQVVQWNEPVTEPDAHLMSASPDLLKALELARSTLSSLYLGGVDFDEEVLNVIWAAIRKARG